MKAKIILLASSVSLAISAQAVAGGSSVIPKHQKNNPWFKERKAHIANKMNHKLPKAKNVILFVGDGMGVSTVTAWQSWYL
ncbi:MAG TPA: alkaline phosphatase, partial [Gammaproteobacteria bacterium]|nr:alkaline phosphatase [Gammaproteobacteria bacterium]